MPSELLDILEYLSLARTASSSIQLMQIHVLMIAVQIIQRLVGKVVYLL